MDEAQLVAGTIETIKLEGWTQGKLLDRHTKRHCILGAIGKARWGSNWDVDCVGNGEKAYRALRTDEVTRRLIAKIARHLFEARGAEQWDFSGLDEVDLKSDPDDFLVTWNDEMLSRMHGEEELIAVLEKVQAEVGLQDS